jgi:hypothetical protein
VGEAGGHGIEVGGTGEADAEGFIFRSDVEFEISVLAFRAEENFKDIPGLPSGLAFATGRVGDVIILQFRKDMEGGGSPGGPNTARAESILWGAAPRLAKFGGRQGGPKWGNETVGRRGWEVETVAGNGR